MKPNLSEEESWLLEMLLGGRLETFLDCDLIASLSFAEIGE